MIYTTVQWSLISLILIVLIHYLFTFFQTNLTVPKVRDLVTKPNDRYNEILSTIKRSDNKDIKKIKENKDTSEYMKNELSSFLNDLKKHNPISNIKRDINNSCKSNLNYSVTT